MRKTIVHWATTIVMSMISVMAMTTPQYLMASDKMSAAYGNPASDKIVWWSPSVPITYGVYGHYDPVVKVAEGLFCQDMMDVTAECPKQTTWHKASIKIMQLDKSDKSAKRMLEQQGIDVDSLATLTDGFCIKVVAGKIYIVGANGRGTAYGLLELSRMAGVTPWVWWGDVVPERKSLLTLPAGYATMQGASIEWRGIFLNDEDWSLRPWSYDTYAPSSFGLISAKTYRRVFELLLRLRANAIWPAMHPGTVAFFNTPGAKAMADSCGIAIGTSHCEPLLRNNVEEWDVKKRGPYNYITNKQAVTDYWVERLKEVKGSLGGNMFTIGMRGIHDGSMEGVKTMKEKFEALQQVIDDQQTLISRYIGKPEKQMQVFVPYKEVLEIYERGLKVPDYVTLMWCDDNYGYMMRLSNSQEQQRSGGGGVYYHLSYWGRPHDYLWLTTTQPGLIYNEMKAAYDHNVRKLWIANVHDPKVAGYDMELFLDMAWNINIVTASTVDDHFRSWLCRQFGQEVGNAIYPAMHEYYRLCGQRRPEFLGWSQTELSRVTYDRGLSPVRNTQFSTTAFGGELDDYLYRFGHVAAIVEKAAEKVRPQLKDAYFAAVLYPVLSASANATKLLEAQRARQMANGSATKGIFDMQQQINISAAKSQDAYQRIRRMTEYYNETMSGGKWRRSMNMRPRDLPVGGAPVLPTLLNDKEVEYYLSKVKYPNCSPLTVTDGTIARNASQWDGQTGGAEIVKMLGHSMQAVSLPKGQSLSYRITTDKSGKAVLHTALIPTQPNDGGDLRFSVTIDDGQPVVFSLKEKFRSEGWKENVLRGQAVKTLQLDNITKGEHTITIKALDHHIIIDQWMLDFNPQRKHYLFPVVQSTQ